MMARNRLLGRQYLLLSLTQNIRMQSLKSLRKDTLDMTQYSMDEYGKRRMTRFLELCVYGIREI